MFTRDSKAPPHRYADRQGRARARRCRIPGRACTWTAISPVGSLRRAPDATLSVSATGSIEGAVQVPNVMLQGTVKGRYPCPRTRVLGATARVEATFYNTAFIEMNPGAQIKESWCALRRRPRGRARGAEGT